MVSRPNERQAGETVSSFSFSFPPGIPSTAKAHIGKKMLLAERRFSGQIQWIKRGWGGFPDSAGKTGLRFSKEFFRRDPFGIACSTMGRRTNHDLGLLVD